MTEIVQWQANTPAAAHGALRLVEWAQEADAAYTLAQRLTSTAFCPDAFRGKPADAAAAMLAGGELGLSPLAALGAFDVINGQARARAITLRAVVQARGHEIVLEESTETRCRMRGRRLGSTEWQRSTWTIDRAKALNLTGKSNWKTQPGTMLVARATSEICRLVASDAILGIGGGISSEESQDGAPVDAPAAEPVPSGTRKMSRPKPPSLPAEPDPSGDAPDRITPQQSKALHASFNDNGITDRDLRLAYCANVVEREITSSNDLTRDEASRCLDALAADRATEDLWATEDAQEATS